MVSVMLAAGAVAPPAMEQFRTREPVNSAIPWLRTKVGTLLAVQESWA
jgi:hypothetical protein